MKVYVVWWQNSDGLFQNWVGSRSDADKVVKKLYDNGDISDISQDSSCYFVYPEDIPTKKSQLLAWLNQHCNNGESSL